jgi:hypothetical protein
MRPSASSGWKCFAVQSDLALVVVMKTDDAPGKSGFATARLTDDRNDLIARDRQIRIVDGDQLLAARPMSRRQLRYLEEDLT